MAKMYPERPLGGTKSSAERKVLRSLSRGLPDRYRVLHSVPICRRASRNNLLREGEIDFLVVDPNKGILVIEVKGGGMERDDVDYIMETFPVVRQRDEKAHGEYRTKRVILEVYDAMAESIRAGTPYETILSPPPADPSVAHEAK